MSSDEKKILRTLSWHYYDNDQGQYEIYVFGRTPELKSVSLRIVGFRLFFYVLLPDFISEQHLFNTCINRIKWKIRMDSGESEGEDLRSPGLVDYQVVYKKKFYPYTGGREFKFLKLFFTNYDDFSFTHKYLCKTESFGGRLEIYEGRVDPILKFIHNRNITTSSYIEIKNTQGDPLHIYNTTDISWKCNYDQVYPYDNPDPKYYLKIMSMDIETFTSGDPLTTFPDPQKYGDYIGVIGITLWSMHDDSKERYAIVKGSCDPVPNTTLIQVNTEKELLLEYVRLIKKLDPDIITGYNIWRFDEFYISTRLQINGLDSMHNAMSRSSIIDTKMVNRKFSSSAYSNNEFNMIDYIGRDTHDLMVAIKREYKLDKYGLSDVSRYFLDEQDKDPIKIVDLMRYMDKGLPSERALVVKYCIQDTNLVVELLKKLTIIPNSIETSCTNFVPHTWLLYRGQQCRVYSLICKYSKKRDFLIPNVMPGNNEKYEGAKVLDPTTGFYMKPIAGLDFASLYPSIMIAHNMCYTTIVREKELLGLKGVCYETIAWKTETGELSEFTFVQDPNNSFETPEGYDPHGFPGKFDRGNKIDPEVLDKKKCYIGILPEILIDLKVGRTNVKKQMEKIMEEEPERYKEIFEYQIYNAKQMSKKVTMNSVYGFSGATIGMLPCKDIAACVTARGRDQILFTKKIIEDEFGAEPVYGDSLPGTEYIRINDNYVRFSDIETYLGCTFKRNENNKEYIILDKDVYTDTMSGKSRIMRVIRHNTNKKLYRITTQDQKTGEQQTVIVTEGHSLITNDGGLVDPQNIGIGMKLFPSLIV